jgi:hypothetical protein
VCQPSPAPAALSFPSPPPQGSACIYSKKVELLYTLVFHTLDMVTQQKRSAQAKASSLRDNGEDADIAGQEEAFLELDDVLQEGNNIDLVEDDVRVRGTRGMGGSGGGGGQVGGGG